MKPSCFTSSNLIFQNNMSIQIPKNYNEHIQQNTFNEKDKTEHQETNTSNESLSVTSSSSTKQKKSNSKKPFKPKNIKPDDQLTHFNIIDRKYPKIRLSKKTLDTLKTLKDKTEYKSFTDLINEMISNYLSTHPSIHLTVRSDQSEECDHSTD